MKSTGCDGHRIVASEMGGFRKSVNPHCLTSPVVLSWGPSRTSLQFRLLPLSIGQRHTIIYRPTLKLWWVSKEICPTFWLRLTLKLKFWRKDDQKAGKSFRRGYSNWVRIKTGSSYLKGQLQWKISQKFKKINKIARTNLVTHTTEFVSSTRYKIQVPVAIQQG